MKGLLGSDGRLALSEYILRSPFSREKLRYHASTGTVIYGSKMRPALKRNVRGDAASFVSWC